MNEVMSSTAASYYSFQPQSYSPLDSSEAQPVAGAEVSRVNHSNASDSASNQQDPNSSSQDAPEEQDSEEQAEQVIAQLQARDREVRSHEQSHLAAAGPYAKGGVSYTYQTGPDGKSYAVGGSVSIDTSPVADDPEATLEKARVVQQAALAPAEPSGQDMAVASQAAQMMQQAQQDIREEEAEALEEAKEDLAETNQAEVSGLSLAQDDDKNQDDRSIEENSAESRVDSNSTEDSTSQVSQRTEFELRVSLQA